MPGVRDWRTQAWHHILRSLISGLQPFIDFSKEIRHIPTRPPKLSPLLFSNASERIKWSRKRRRKFGVLLFKNWKFLIRFTLANEFSKIFQHRLSYALYITFNFIVMSGMLLQRQSKSQWLELFRFAEGATRNLLSFPWLHTRYFGNPTPAY